MSKCHKKQLGLAVVMTSDCQCWVSERSLVVGESVEEGCHRPQRRAHIRMPRVEIVVRTDNLRALRRRGVGPDLSHVSVMT